MENFLEKEFKHHKWFLGGVTVGYALDYFAKGEGYLDKKLTPKKEMSLFEEDNYDDVLRSSDYRDRATYRLSKEEKAYFLERVEYWRERKEREHKEWLETEIDLEKGLKRLLAGNSYYDVSYAERQRDVWRDKYNDQEMVSVWEGYVKERMQSRNMIDNLISLHRDTIKTNGDFRKFEEILRTEVYDKFPA
ncbi:hypothetical protein QTG56_24740 (plasmid) [Rossellomorea sp. AcN35-11]|nr:hypothetical protein [Rossellomorea aquimaris]WJV31843.1 hypothetical protein QTG56_24740 [Rossellomorea sp. AcN35-11]